MASPALIIRDQTTGRIKNSGNTKVALFFGIATIGGAGSAQSGTITDDRFLWSNDKVVFTLVNGFVGMNGYEPTISISGNTLTWSYPSAGSSAPERPIVTFIYGVS